MLPLMAGLVTTRSSQWAPVLIAFCIIVPQAIVALAAPWVGRMAQRWGRRPFLLAGFAALAIRGLLFAVEQRFYELFAIDGHHQRTAHANIFEVGMSQIQIDMFVSD